MSNNPQALVTPQQVAALKVELTKMEAWLKEVEKAEKAGIDVASQKQQLITNMEKAKKIISVYG